ncbi:MAG: hypothetical protein HOC78_03120 [Candidatus Komeilibacteria bacterium]|nr:hypothetical protein [Candidatus Komeilibacteria bacterium]
MNKAKFFRSFMVMAIFLWSIPQSGQAVDIDWFGNSSQEKIKYYEGYNDALAVVTSNSLPYKTSVSSTDVSDLQKQINALTAKVDTLKVTTNIDDKGVATVTSTDNFVTNPMSENLDVNNYRIGNYSASDRTVHVDGNLNLRNGEYPWALYSTEVHVENYELNHNAIGSYSYGDRATAGQFTTTGDNTKAGSFFVAGPNSYAVYATVSSTNSYAGYFDGKVRVSGVDSEKWVEIAYAGDPNGEDTVIHGQGKFLVEGGNELKLSAGEKIEFQWHGIEPKLVLDTDQKIKAYTDVEILDGDLTVDRINSGIEAVYFDSDVNLAGGTLYGRSLNFTTMEDNQLLLKSSAFGNNSTAGLFQAVGQNSVAIHGMASSTDSWAGYFDGKVGISDNGFIKDSSANWGGMVLGSQTDVGVIFDSNNDDPASAFRVMTDGDDFDVASNLFIINSEGNVGIGTETPNKDLHVYSDGENAEIDIQSGSNTHWGIYQDNSSGDLNFWHGDNKVTFGKKGLFAEAFCLDNKCIKSWKDLKDILEPEIGPDSDINIDNSARR